jgi:hypothetical protein
LKPQTDLELASCTAPFSMLAPGRFAGEMTRETYIGALSLLHYHAAHCPPFSASWPFELDGLEVAPPADVITDEAEYAELAARCKAQGGFAHRVRNQAAIDAVALRNDVRKRAAWPWIWARALLAECPPVHVAPPAENGKAPTRLVR